jgi:hypothetical protein
MTDPNDLRKVETWLRDCKADLWMAECCEDAADDIERLQRSVTDWQLEADVHCNRAAAAVAEIARLRLTSVEREAIEWCIEMATLHATECDDELASLRSMLERLK